MTDDECLAAAMLLGAEFRQETFALWRVRLPGARYWDAQFHSKGSAARAALYALLNPPTEVTMRR